MQSSEHAMADTALNVPAQAAYSRFHQRLHRRYGDELSLLPPGPPERASMEQALSALLERGLDLTAALRVLRQLVMERTMVLDCEQQAPLAVVTRAVTELAELALERARSEERRVGKEGRSRWSPYH